MDRKKIIAVTNRHLAGGDPLQRIEEIAAAGPGALILREKDLSREAYLGMARDTYAICTAQGVTMFVHGHPGIAKKIGCSAIHLSIPGLRTYIERGSGRAESSGEVLCGPLRDHFDRVSISCHSMEDVREAVRGGATQVILGNIFETDCKKGLPGKGLAFLREIAAASPVPVYAIGGIRPEHLDEVLRAGAAGGCMMSWWYRNV